jgi:hypothetical protein
MQTLMSNNKTSAAFRADSSQANLKRYFTS